MGIAKQELGTKRTCPKCGVRFYDLCKDPIVCYSCNHIFIPEVILPGKDDASIKSVANTENSSENADNDNIIETGLIVDDVEDIDVVETADKDDSDDVFLEEDEGSDPGVSGLINNNLPKDDEEI